MKSPLAAALAASALMTSLVVPARAAEPSVPAREVALPDPRQAHLLSCMLPGLSATAVQWEDRGLPGKVGFVVTVETDATRYRVVQFFRPDCSGDIAALRASLIEAGKPVSFLRPEVKAATELVVRGSFARTLDGKFGPVRWDRALLETVGEESGLPKEDSDYARELKARINALQATQTAARAAEVIEIAGELGGRFAEATQNAELARIAGVVKAVSGREAAASSGQTNTVQATPMERGIENVSNLARDLFKRPAR